MTAISLDDLPEPQQTRMRDALAQPLRAADSADGWVLQEIVAPAHTLPGTYWALLTHPETGRTRRLVASRDWLIANVTTYGPKADPNRHDVPLTEIRADVQAALPDGVKATIRAEGDGGHVVIEVTGLRDADADLTETLTRVADAYNRDHHDGHTFYLVSVRFETRTPEQIAAYNKAEQQTADWFAMMEEDA